VLVFDFGGGTCDVSIVEIVKNNYRVLASNGDNQLGGEDFDDCLMDYIVKKFQKKHKGIKLEPSDKRRLRRQCETAKRDLTDYESADVNVARIAGTRTNLEETITASRFQELTSDLCKRILEPIKQCLLEAKLTAERIDKVVLVGGMSHMKQVQNLLKEYFPKTELDMRTNPDEAIAHGAAIQAAILSGQYQGDLQILDILPISLGIKVDEDQYYVIVPKNSPLPIKITKTGFTTPPKFEPTSSLFFVVYQGEDPTDLTKNVLLGKFKLSNINNPLPGRATFAVTFEVNEDGILSVTASEEGANNTNQITLTRNQGWGWDGTGL
jgi:molecular chaperone DnaK (HSP70)